MDNKGICFVIMGYGIKTDLTTGRELNLDKTYKNIIKPAAEEAGLTCIRADEIKHSGTIDVPMYKYLINADVVIADLSTNNSNAFYELGVRHALRPKTTIAIAENKLKPPFDVNHTIIRQYEHLGSDIGYEEVLRFRKELVETINEILHTPDIDSPVYTYIKNLTPPIFENDEIELDKKGTTKETLGSIIENAIIALDKNDFITAKSLLQIAHSLDQNNDFIIQKLALATYKSKHPSHLEALKEALEILKPLNLSNTTDPETLGLAGAIYKRIWEESESNVEALNNSIFYYEKGFYIKNDYYNGINLAYLYNLRGSIISIESDRIADYVFANRVRKAVIDLCMALYQDDNFKNRGDQYWITATLEEAFFGLNDETNFLKFKEVSEQISKENWERKTTLSQLSKLQDLLQKSPLK